MIRAWPITAGLVALAIVATVSKDVASVALPITVLVVAALAFIVDDQARALEKHEEAIQWFKDHVRVSFNPEGEPFDIDSSNDVV